jgi:hypothetical protein
MVASTSSPTAAPSSSASAPTERAARPLYYTEPIFTEELEGRTLRELALMRNTIYARAGQTFRKPWLAAYFQVQPWYRPSAKIDESKITDVDRANAKQIALADYVGRTRADYEHTLDEILARRRAGRGAPEDDIELRLLSERLGRWLGDDASPFAERSPLEDPSRLDRLLHVRDLEHLSRRDLRMLRNLIYARRGRVFDSFVLSRYYEVMSWYQPDPRYSAARLSEIDQKNVRIIQSVERSLGGALSDAEQKRDDGWLNLA